MSLLYHDLGCEVEAFTAGKCSVLPYRVIQPHQIHGDSIAIVTDRKTKREDLERIDAIITYLADCPIGVRTADCVPVLLYDPDNRVIAAIHSGWRGTAKKNNY